ncbi:hypothetical protein 65p251 [Aeromonas phage 65]|uniref:Uncharacterized protein n=2 Tax=Ishigurovirus osborne TaxID=260149 RepID=A0A219YD44_9CAUD|nr:hypothetical protein ST65p251 [Aeromonas phage 65]ADQ53259.1 hypothetical protein 65p251 [Aeromonas phage 65]APU01633.1 hypothetical protein [Aeromonas phage 65.2]
MKVTYYLSYDLGCVRIPYPMKKEYNQHPEDILSVYRSDWKVIPRFPDHIRSEYDFGFGDFVVVEEIVVDTKATF